MKLFDVGKVVSSSIGMAAAMSLSSLFLWKSDWLSVPSGAFYGSHGVGIAIGVVVSAVAMLWCTLSRRSLRHFGMGVVPCVALASLLVSGLPMVEGTAQWVLGIAIPVAGSYALVFSWFYVISLRDIEVSLMTLLLAWVVSFFARTFFESFTGAAVTLAISTALMAASWILLLAQNRQIDLASPMATCSFADNRVSYIHGLGSFWRSVLYCGAFAFLGGVVRFLSIDTTAMTFVNYGSALAGLFAPIALMLLWRFRTVRYTIDGVFRLAFPLIVVALGALPFAYGTPLVVAAALLYMIYSFLSLSVQILAVQVSHDYGIDPVFCLSFQTLVCVAAQGLGYLLGALAPCGTAFDVSPYAVIALGSVCFLALVLYGTRALHPSRSETSRLIEFLSLARTREGATDPASDGAIDLDADDAIAEEALGDAEQPHYEDKTALRCDLIGRKYALSQREIEVMALVARGHTISSIATELFISDNTVKTHLRRLYQKLDIHKKQELFALINSYVD
ncbi:helix-turn-helix transcriptional regulator [Adlercreutzia equolifaciens]|uniref:helix-turn-helix transcriptional regulator n=1 Tax=Adlercreutzia equolifaciens TaxID=446660 RepID=UPI003A8F4758